MTAPHETTVEEFATLAAQCSRLEWERLVCTAAFLQRAFISLGEAEKAASAFLGRKISATAQILKPSENETL